MIMKQMDLILEEHGFTKQEVKKGDAYDTTIMEAVDAVEGGTVVGEVFSEAYMLHDKIVRPAKVLLVKETK